MRTFFFIKAFSSSDKIAFNLFRRKRECSTQHKNSNVITFGKAQIDFSYPDSRVPNAPILILRIFFPFLSHVVDFFFLFVRVIRWRKGWFCDCKRRCWFITIWWKICRLWEDPGRNVPLEKKIGGKKRRCVFAETRIFT